MRVISQDGTIDVPYENFVFGIIEDNFIVAIRDTIARPSEIAQGVVAKYSTKEKAEEAMKQLKYAYLCHNRVKIEREYPICDDKTQEGIGGVYTFPQDDEVNA